METPLLPKLVQRHNIQMGKVLRHEQIFFIRDVNRQLPHPLGNHWNLMRLCLGQRALPIFKNVSILFHSFNFSKLNVLPQYISPALHQESYALIDGIQQSCKKGLTTHTHPACCLPSLILFYHRIRKRSWLPSISSCLIRGKLSCQRSEVGRVPSYKRK